MISGILKDDEAVSPILGAILILAIGITVITNVQLNFVPVWNKQEELDHLAKMNDDFRALKSSIEESAVGGTALSTPLSMGFKYSPKVIVYNPRESAWATLSIEKDVWAEVRYNEMLADGMEDATSIKNITASTITYSLHGAQTLDSFIYEHGLIRRSNSNYTSSTQMLLSNGTMYVLGVNATEPETTKGVGKRLMNIYPASQPKNTIIGKNVWLILRTRYPGWWTDASNPASLQKQGATIKKIDSTDGIIIAYFDSMVIRMGETQVTAMPRKPPSHSPPVRLVRVSPQNVNLPIDGVSSLAVEVQDYYNNPVPNAQVNFSINTTRNPSNAYATATLLQDSAVSGADGRANILLRTSGAGMYYIDASLSEPSYTATFVYPASSQSGYITLAYTEVFSDRYNITAALKNGFGEALSGEWISFAGSEGTLTPNTNQTDGSGVTRTTLNTSSAAGIKLTNIQTSGITDSSAIITWDTINTITVTANRTPGGYIFNSLDIPTNVSSGGCVRYGTLPGYYPDIVCDSQRSSHNISLSGLLPYTAYYFTANSSRSGGASVNSSEYMFVTDAIPDSTPPAGVTNLRNNTYEPLYIRWTWVDPSDADFDHVEVYIDGILKSNVTKGVQSYNASYFRPNSTHEIETRTVDTYGNVNTTWVNNTASTPSVYTYIFSFINTTGTVTGFSSAQNDSDGGASAIFTESLIGGTDTNNYTYITSFAATNGNVTNFANMQSAGDSAFATLTEGANTSSMLYTWAFAATNESWVSNYTATGGTVTMAFTGADGNPVGSIYSRLSNAGVATARTATTTWTSPNFTWTNGTPLAARLDFDWRVATYTQANSGSYYVILVKPDGSTAQIYPTTAFSATAAWSTKSNTTISTGSFSQSGNYSLKLIAVMNTKANVNGLVEVRWDDPAITLNFTSYRLNITADTASVPADTNYYLEINYSRDTNGTGYDIYVFDGTAWNYRDSINSTVWTVFNYTLSSAEYNAGNPRIRYVDQNPAGITQGNLFIDYQRIHGFTPSSPPSYRLDIITNTTAIPDATAQVLQMRYNVSGENFTLQTWNGSAWNNRTTLNDTVMSYRNITLLPEELMPDGTLPGNSANLNKYYVLVRYLDENPGAAQQGSLYLDYQRVYSS